MRVLQVVPGLSAKFGGPSVALPGLARALASYGAETWMYTTDADRAGRLDVPLNRPIVRDGVTYVYHHVIGLAGRYGLSPALWRHLSSTVRQFDIVHIHWLYDFSCIAAASAAVAASVPFVVQPNGSLDPHLLRKNRAIKRTYLATIGRPLVRQADALVFTSEEERQQATYGGRRPEWVVPVGLDAGTFRHLPPRGTFRAAFPQVDGPFLLFVGRLSRQKGVDLLLKSFAVIAGRYPDLRLVLAGPDPDGYAADLKAIARDAGIESRVLFTGLLPHDLKLAAFVDARLFTLTSYAENFGAVITEALACGAPVLISDRVNIHREMQQAGVATVVQCSVDSIVAGLESALADATLPERIARLGPSLVNQAYTWDAIVPGLVARYENVIASRDATRPSSAQSAREMA